MNSRVFQLYVGFLGLVIVVMVVGWGLLHLPDMAASLYPYRWLIIGVLALIVAPFLFARIRNAFTVIKHGDILVIRHQGKLVHASAYHFAAVHGKTLQEPIITDVTAEPEPLQIAGPQLPAAPPFRSIAHLMTSESIILTYTSAGPVYGEVSDLLSMALVGKPKRGKTTALLYYLCILLLAHAEVWVWDPHGEMSELAYGLNYFDRLEDIAKSVPYLEKQLNERDALYKATKQVKHPLVLLVDELPVIAEWERTQRKLKHEVPSPYYIMKRFTLEARKWNGYVFISGQSLPAEVLPTLTRDNLSSRLVLECSKDHARMIGLDKTAIDTMLPLLKGAERGTHIADFSSWSQPELADIPYTTISDLRSIIDGQGNDISNTETFVEADVAGDGNVLLQGTPESVGKITVSVGKETREIIRRMYKKDMPLGEIATLVGLAGRKYHIFQQVCKEEGIA